jgi:hypothetical protein
MDDLSGPVLMDAETFLGSASADETWYGLGWMMTAASTLSVPKRELDIVIGIFVANTGNIAVCTYLTNVNETAGTITASSGFKPEVLAAVSGVGWIPLRLIVPGGTQLYVISAGSNFGFLTWKYKDR